MPLLIPSTLPGGSGFTPAVTAGIETLTYVSGLTGQAVTFGDSSLANVLYKGLTGHGMAPLEHFVVDTAYQPGAKFVRTKKKTSVVTVTLTVFGDPTTPDVRASLWNTLDAILRVLEPAINTAGTLIKTDSTGVQRQLANCQYVGGFEVADKAENRAYLTIELLFEAYDPTWYSLLPATASIGTSLDAHGFAVPIQIPLLIKGQASNSTLVTNNGNIFSRPVFTFNGPCINPSILNSTTNESFALATTLFAGDILVVDCGQGAVTYTPASGTPVPLYSAFGGRRQFVRLAPGQNTLQFNRDNPTNNQCTVTFFHTWNHG